MTPTELSALGKRRAESLGLQLWCEGYKTDDVHALLGAGAIAFGAYDGGPLHYPWSGNKCDADTHSALLIGIKPLKVDTAESLLRELMERNNAGEADRQIIQSIHMKAQALLDGGG